MYTEHWSDDQLIDRLYGIGPEDGHLEKCASCTRRWEAVRNREESLRPAEIEVSEEQLAAQRRVIRARLGENRRVLPRVLVPVLVTMLVAMVLIVNKRTPTPRRAVDTVSDAQLFDDIFNRISGAEPSSMGPIRSLFEEQK